MPTVIDVVHSDVLIDAVQLSGYCVCEYCVANPSERGSTLGFFAHYRPLKQKYGKTYAPTGVVEAVDQFAYIVTGEHA